MIAPRLQPARCVLPAQSPPIRWPLFFATGQPHLLGCDSTIKLQAIRSTALCVAAQRTTNTSSSPCSLVLPSRERDRCPTRRCSLFLALLATLLIFLSSQLRCSCSCLIKSLPFHVLILFSSNLISWGDGVDNHLYAKKISGFSMGRIGSGCICSGCMGRG